MCPFLSISVHSQRQIKVAGKPTQSCGGETRSSTSNENAPNHVAEYLRPVEIHSTLATRQKHQTSA